MTDTTPQFEAGAEIGGRYVIESLVGSGAMGQVFRAHDPLVDRPVAIKVLNAAGIGSEGRGSLMNEARSAGSLSNTNVVSVYDVGVIEADSSSPYIVMEFVEGKSLHNYTISGMEELIELAKGIARGLADAHASGIIHRDLKPENVIVSESGVPKLADFGLARSASSRLSVDGTLSGTVFYMAPEVALAKPVDARSDLYSLGVMLYEKSTGELPFFDPDPLAVISQHIHAPVIPPAARNEAIPAGLNALIVELMAKDPDDRPQSASAVVDRLEKLDLLLESEAVSPEIAVLERIARHRHVGREVEMAAAKGAWLDAIAGKGSTMLIAGEPGIGKSRLLRELGTLAEVSGARYLSGECYEEGGAPYAPMGQILKSLTPWIGRYLESVPNGVLADLASLSKSFAVAFPEITIPKYVSGEAKQQAMADSLLALFETLAARQPLLISVEDLHWSDHGTLSLLLHLARNLRGARVLIVATYRDAKLGLHKSVSKVLHELNRSRLARVLTLDRLSRSATQVLLASVFLQEVSDELGGEIHRITDGNPFYIEEVCKGLIWGGELYFEEGRWQRAEIAEFAIPRSVKLAIQERIRQLPTEVQESLLGAAFVGRNFEYELLRGLVKADEANLIEHLEAAERAQLIEAREVDNGIRFRFNHALVPGTLRESVSVLRRRPIHRKLAETLVESGSREYERIAKHFGHGAVRSMQFEYLLKAGRAANEGAAFDDADSLVREALEIAIESADQRWTMLANEMLAGVHVNSGAQDIVLTAIADAVSAWNSIPEDERIRDEGLRVLTYAACIRRSGFPVDGTVEFADAALALLEDEGEEETRSKLYVARSLGQQYLIPEEDINVEGANADGERALEIAEKLGDPNLISGALDALAGARWLQGHVEEPYKILERRIALLDRLDMREVRDVYGMAIRQLTVLGRFVEAEEFVEKLEALQYTMTPRNQIFFYLTVRSLYGEWGDFSKLYELTGARIEQLAANQLRYGPSDGNKEGLALRLAIQGHIAELVERPRFDLDTLEQRGVESGILEQPGRNEKFVRVMEIEGRVRVLCELGRLDEAAELIESVGALVESVPSHSWAFDIAVPVLKCYQGDRSAMERFDRVLAGKTELSLTKPRIADARWLRGLLLFNLGEHEQAVSELDQAIELLDEIGVLFKNGIAHRTRSQVLLELGRQEEAKSDFARAIELLEESGAKFSVSAAKEIGSQLGLIG